MLAQGPVIVVGDQAAPREMSALNSIAFSSVSWADIDATIGRIRPAAVVAAITPDHRDALRRLAAAVAQFEPYTPLIAIGAEPPLPASVIPFTMGDIDGERLDARLRAALRVRSLHATVLRRMAAAPTMAIPATDPLSDATVLLMGRGDNYPALSVALGSRVGVVGALGVEPAARHLDGREFDGIVIGDGFTQQAVKEFLDGLAQDVRFRNLPVILAPDAIGASASPPALPFLEFAAGGPEDMAEHAMPLVRLHAFEARMIRLSKAIEARGLLDPRSGLLTNEAFMNDLTVAIGENTAPESALSAVRFTFSAADPREQHDAARIISRLMRRTDFASLFEDGSIIMVFTGATETSAQQIARRLAAVLKYSVHSSHHDEPLEVRIAIASRQPGDTVQGLLQRLQAGATGATA